MLGPHHIFRLIDVQAQFNPYATMKGVGMDELSWSAELPTGSEVREFDRGGRIEFQNGQVDGFVQRTVVRPGMALYTVEGIAEYAWTLAPQGEAPAGSLVIGTIINGAGVIAANGNQSQEWRGSRKSYLLSLAERDIAYHLRPCERWQAVALLLKPEALENFASQNGTLPPCAQAVLDDGTVPILNMFEHGSAVLRIAHDIIRSPYRGTMDALWRESKALELLAHQFDHLNFRRQSAKPLSPRELLQVKDAYDLLVSDLRDPPGVNALAAQVRMAPRRLNQGFREVYGSTAFETLIEARMKVAHAMLLERRDIPLKHLAWLVGYTQLSNFISAYRRRFGMAPGQMRRTQ